MTNRIASLDHADESAINESNCHKLDMCTFAG